MSSRPTRADAAGRTYLDLQNLARRTQRTTQELLHLYALEGFLARLAISAHARQLVLKGGVLLAAYGTRRATRDIDLQGRHLSNDAGELLGIVQKVATVAIEDGLTFLPDTAAAQNIREDDNYHGVRVSLIARIATADIAFHVDINVGDPIWPSPQPIIVPGLLGRDVALAGYPLTMVHAEKLITALDRGRTNTRWRDFADVYTLSGQHTVNAAELLGSTTRVAAYRKVPLVPLQTALDGWADVAQSKWAIWRRKQTRSDALPAHFGDTLAAITDFADPILAARIANDAVWHPTDRTWR